MGRTIYSEILKGYPDVVKAMNVRHYVYNTTLEHLYKLEKEGRAFIICPQKTDKVTIISRNKEELVTLYNEGKVTVEEQMEKLKRFIGE